jgi:hypothetical protein
VVLVRLRDDPATRTYATRRWAEGKGPRDPPVPEADGRRRLFKPLGRFDRAGMEVVKVV